MIAQDLISKDFPTLRLTDTGSRAIDIMENYMVSELAIIKEGVLNGVISMNNIYDFDLFEKQLEDNILNLQKAYVFSNLHFFEVLKSFELYNISILPVIDTKSNYLGTITQKSIIKGISNIFSVKETGFYLKFRKNHNDYSATEISNIVEKNDGKLLSIYYDNYNSSEITIYIKIRTSDIEAILQSFERFNYNVTILNTEPNDYNKLYNERMDNFLHFLNI